MHRHGNVTLTHVASWPGVPFHRRREVTAVEIEVHEVEEIKCTDMSLSP